jgi:hypothetical protein
MVGHGVKIMGIDADNSTNGYFYGYAMQRDGQAMVTNSAIRISYVATGV